MKSMTKGFVIAAAVVCLGAATSVRAGVVVFNDFGPGDSYGASGYELGYDHNVGLTSEIACGFTVAAGQNYTLSEIDFAASIVSGTNAIGVALLADSGGVPGTTLESWTVSGLGQYPALTPPEVVISTLHPTLLAGQQYWLALTMGDSTTFAVWHNNSIGVTGPGYVISDGRGTLYEGDTGFVGAFRVEGTSSAVPEPSTLAGAGIAVFLGLGYAWRRRKAKHTA